MNGFIKFPRLFILLFFLSSKISVEQLEWLRNYSETIFFCSCGRVPFSDVFDISSCFLLAPHLSGLEEEEEEGVDMEHRVLSDRSIHESVGDARRC